MSTAKPWECEMNQREHILQAFAVKFLRAAIEGDYIFLSFDRSKPPGRSREAQLGAMARQKARGIQAGTPDSVLLVPNMPPMWIEWKAVKQRPTPQQTAMGNDLQCKIGHHWGWYDNITDAYAWLHDLGVPMRQGAGTLALQFQGMVDSAIAKREAKKGAANPRKKASKALSRAAIARLTRAGLVV